MVSYYTPAAMYRHQQTVNPQTPPQFHQWYTAGYHPHQQTAPSYCMQEEQMWHNPQMPFHHHHHPQDFGGFGPHQGNELGPEQHELPSPPITVSGSEMSSPGAVSAVSAGGGSPSVGGRPVQIRSPFEWIKKTSYQTQPNPGKLFIKI